jgi:PKD repeat protein
VRFRVPFLVALLSLLLAAPAASAARTLYVPNNTSGNLSSYAVGANSSLTPLAGSPLSVGNGPETAVLTPDGKFLFLTKNSSDQVQRFSVAADGSPTSLGATSLTVDAPRGAAVSPDGTKLYIVGNNGLRTYSIAADGAVTEVATTALTGVIGVDVAVTPDGRSLYAIGVIGAPDDTIFHVPLGTDGVPTAGSTVVATAPASLQRLAVTPEGRFIYTASSAAGQSGVRGYAIGAGGALTAVPGSPFSTGGATYTVATSPAAPVLFASEADTDTARAFTVGADGALTAAGSALPAGGDPSSMTVTPSGMSMFTIQSLPNDVGRFDVASNGVISSAGANTATAAGVGLGPHVSPDQGPVASFTADAVLGGSPTSFNAGSSSDSDGTIARYDWDFGDGTTLPNGGPVPQHTYTTAGTYNVTLTVTDNEGCSLTKTYTGQVVGCNPGAARITKPVQSLPHPPPVIGLSLTKVSANHYCIGPGPGAGSDIKVAYTLNGPAKVTFELQRRTTPVASPRSVCPVRNKGGPGPVPVQFGALGSTTLDGKAGENFATVDKSGKTTTATAARSTGGTAAPAAPKPPVAKAPKRKPLVKTLKIKKKGKQRATLRGVFGATDLAPGWYRVLIHGVRADGSQSQYVAVKFWVLGPIAKRRR